MVAAVRERGNAWSTLPAEVAAQALKLLETGIDIASARLVCRCWADVIAASQKDFASPRRRRGPVGWGKSFKGLEALSWATSELGQQLADEGSELQHLKQMQTLKLGNAMDSDLIVVGRTLTTLTSLDIGALLLDMRDEPLLQMVDSGQSRTVNVSDLGIAALAELRCLTSLNLKGCHQLTDTGVRVLEKLSALKSLNVSDCIRVTGHGLSVLRHLSQLTSLDLGGCTKIGDEGLSVVEALPSLEFLNLRRLSVLDDEKLSTCLSSLPSLTSLDLSQCFGVTDRVIRSLHPLTGLRNLTLAGCSCITNEGLANLTAPNLTSLSLKNCDVWDKGLAALRRLTALTRLELGQCDEITNAGLEELAPLAPSLTHLDLALCDHITDAGLAVLRGMTSLKKLEVYGCLYVTSKGRRSLRRRLPGLEIDY